VKSTAPAKPEIAKITATVLSGQVARFSFGYWINWALMVLIILNVAAVIVESVQPIYNTYQLPFYYFEVVSVVIFSLEYIARIWSAPQRSDLRGLTPIQARFKYAVSPMALIDLAAIAPFYLSMLVAIDLRFLRALRLLRLFKFTRHSRALQLLGSVLRTEGSNLLAAFSVLFVLLILASSGMYFIESHYQPDHFGSIPEAMWWAMATLTTVGYGDVTPITGWGRFFGGLITIIGMGMVALPAGILASGFAEQLAQRRQNFKTVIATLLAQSRRQDIDDALIDALRQALQIDASTAEKLLQEAKKDAENG